MATFTVHVPPGAINPASRADQTVFVRDGFSWPAFLFGPLFLLYRRLWIATAAWVGVAVGLAFLGRSLHLPPGAQTALFALLAGLTGLEAASLRQGSLDRRGFVQAELLSRGSREEAERAFFATAPQPPARPPSPGPVTRSPEADEDVIGLFPRSGDVG